MKPRLAILALITMSMWISCTPPVARFEEPPATPKPTPHPAAGAQARAMQLYPELAVKDSLFNRTFVELVEHSSQKDPLSLAEIDWPITLAHRTGKMLGVAPGTPAPATTPVPMSAPVAEVEPPATRDDNPLERGAYNRTRAVNSRYYYYNGYYYSR